MWIYLVVLFVDNWYVNIIDKYCYFFVCGGFVCVVYLFIDIVFDGFLEY